MKFYEVERDDLIAQLQTNPESGLASERIEELHAQYGLNKFD